MLVDDSVSASGGHTNPTIEVVRELVRRGHEVRYYSFEEFRERVEGAGAEFVACDAFLPPVDTKAERRLRKVSTTEMSVQSFRTVANLDPLVSADVASWRPDVVVSDSACFWGKLAAAKHGLPWMCSTTTFAFNEHSSKYMSHSASELADLVLGLPRLNREIRRLRTMGYEVKSALDIVRNRSDDDTVVRVYYYRPIVNGKVVYQRGVFSCGVDEEWLAEQVKHELRGGI